MVRHLVFLQVDLTAHVAPSADLVCWTRLGSSYSPADLEALCIDGSLVELGGLLRPAEDIALFRAQMAEWPGPPPLREWEEDIESWVLANEECRLDILEALRSEGPLPARELPDSCAVPWRSTGWTNDKNVLRMLGFMEQRGEVAVSSRENRERLWDLAERVYGDGDVVPFDEAVAELCRRRLTALGIARQRTTRNHLEPNDVGEAGEPAVIEGVRGRWRVDPAQLCRPFEGRTALLSPLDRLVFDRKRMADVFGSDYQLEMYKPAAKRRWGYWAMPILHGDDLVGKLDAEADRDGGVLRVRAVHEDAPFTTDMRGDVDREIRDLATWLELEIEFE
jgi:uncharacterized protein YcaQ